MTDEFDTYHQEAMRDPVYAEAYRRAELRPVEDARERRVARIVRRINRRAMMAITSRADRQGRSADVRRSTR